MRGTSLLYPRHSSLEVSMEATVERIDLTYEAAFGAPTFDLPLRGSALLKSLYEAIHPRYPIPLTHMQIFGGNAMSDVRVRITLFNGNGSIDVTADKMFLNFSDVRGKDGIDICKDCILSSERALTKVLPELNVRFVTIRPTLLVNVGAEGDQEVGFLSDLRGDRASIDLSEFEGASQHKGVNLSIKNAKAGWSVIFHTFHNQAAVKSFVISCHAQYEEYGDIRGLENREHHLRMLLGKFTDGIGLEFPNSSGETK